MTRPLGLKLHQLQYLIALAEQGSLRQAAQQYGVSPTAISRGLQDLENAVGQILFDRKAQGRALTDAGRTLLARARIIVAETDEALLELDNLRTHTETRLAIGITPWIAQSLLPLAVKRFLAKRPDVCLDIQETVGTTYAALRDGKIDMAIGMTPPADSARDLVCRTLFSHGQAVVCRQGHGCQGARKLEELAEQSWLLSREIEQFCPRLQEFFQELCQQERRKTHGRLHYTRSSYMAVQIVENSDMLTVAPWPFVEAAQARYRVETLPLLEALPENTTSYLTRRNTPSRGLIDEFIEALMNTVNEDCRNDNGLLRRIFHSIEIA